MATKQKSKGTDAIYQMVTDKIIAALEEGVVPWKRPWKVAGGHKNLVSKKTYRGINQFILDLTAQEKDFETPYWLTFNQAKELGGSVRKSEKATIVVFFKPLKIELKERDRNGDKLFKTIPLLRFYRVFNVEQCDDIDPAKLPEPEAEFEPLERAEQVIRDMPKAPKLVHTGDIAAYNPKTDSIQLPRRKQFTTVEGYYGTSFHEHVHSTGHPSRVGRFKPEDRWELEPYAKEELVAELGAAMLSAVTGVNIEEEQSAAYIEGWINRLNEDKKFIVSAGAQAQRAVDFILGEAKSDG